MSCLTLYDPVDCSPPGSSVHGVSQASILEWVAISFLQVIVPTQGWNPGLLPWQADSLLLSHLGVIIQRQNLKPETPFFHPLLLSFLHGTCVR